MSLYKLYMELIGLQDEDLSEFKRLLQESFQYGYENVYGKCEELVLPEKDIDECLKKENTHAYVMKNTGIILGGVIVETNEKTQHNHLDFPVCKRNHSKQRHRTEDME